MDLDEKGLAAARRRAAWEIGDPAWASIIINAYLSPDESDEDIASQKRSMGVLN